MPTRGPLNMPYPFPGRGELPARAVNEIFRDFEEIRGIFIPETDYVAGTTPHSTGNSGITALGNGTLLQSYSRVGDWVKVSFQLVFGSTTVLAASPNALAVGLPFPARPNQMPVGTTWARDTAPYDTHASGTGFLVLSDADGNLTQWRPHVHMSPGDKRGNWSHRTAQTFPNGGAVFLDWDAEALDTDSLLAPTSNTVTVTTPGTYLIDAFLGLDSRPDYVRGQIGILGNGVTWHALNEWSNYTGGALSMQPWLKISAVVLVPSVGRNFQVRVFQTNSAAATVGATSGSTRGTLNVTRLGSDYSGIDGHVNAICPYLWASGDTLYTSLIYEVADGY